MIDPGNKPGKERRNSTYRGADNEPSGEARTSEGKKRGRQTAVPNFHDEKGGRNAIGRWEKENFAQQGIKSV